MYIVEQMYNLHSFETFHIRHEYYQKSILFCHTESTTIENISSTSSEGTGYEDTDDTTETTTWEETTENNTQPSASGTSEGTDDNGTLYESSYESSYGSSYGSSYDSSYDSSYEDSYGGSIKASKSTSLKSGVTTEKSATGSTLEQGYEENTSSTLAINTLHQQGSTENMTTNLSSTLQGSTVNATATSNTWEYSITEEATISFTANATTIVDTEWSTDSIVASSNEDGTESATELLVSELTEIASAHSSAKTTTENLVSTGSTVTTASSNATQLLVSESTETASSHSSAKTTTENMVSRGSTVATASSNTTQQLVSELTETASPH